MLIGRRPVGLISFASPLPQGRRLFDVERRER
jgi:hypothetical protein